MGLLTVLAQTNTIVNMTGHMMDSARVFNLRVADELLTRGDTKAAADQVNLAGIQLALFNINQTQTMEFVVGGSLSSMKMAANCIIDY